MFLERLRVKNWRSLADVTLSLSPGLNVVHGPNESGKSTLQEALRSAFLSPPRPKGKSGLSAARPWGRGKATPEVEVEFIFEGQRWRLLKKFFAAGSSLQRGNVVVAQDDAVHAFLQERLAEQASLWAPQGHMEAAEVPAEMRPQLAASETVTPGIAWLEEQLRERYETFWTAGRGMPKKPLQEVRQRALDAELAVAELRKEQGAGAAMRRELAHLGQELQALSAALQAGAARLATERPLLGAWETYRKGQAELRALEQTAEQVTNWLGTWDRLCAAQEELRPRLTAWLEQKTRLEGQLGEAPDRGTIEALQARLAGAQALKARALRAEYEALRPPTREQVAQLDKLAGRMQSLQETLELASWRGELQALTALTPRLQQVGQEAVELSLQAGETHEWRSAEGFTLELPGVARLWLMAPAQQAAEELARVKKQHQGLLELIGADARQRLERATELKGQMGAVPDVEVPQGVLPEETETLPTEIARAEAEWKVRQAEHSAASRALQALLQTNPAVEMQRLEAELAEMGDADIGEVRARLGELHAEIAQRRTQLVAPQGAEVAADALRALEVDLAEQQAESERLAARRNQLLGELKGQKELYSRLARAEEAWARAAAEQRRVDLEANAAKTLWETFSKARKALEQDLVGPLRERLSARLQRLTGYPELQMQADFRPSAVLTAGGHAASLGDLSFGTREQLAFLSRLCLADLLSEHERALVVFDDNLVHTDPGRLALACSMMQESAARSQILLLTCHPERYLPLLPEAAVHPMAR
jgi:hypothetical protein